MILNIGVHTVQLDEADLALLVRNSLYIHSGRCGKLYLRGRVLGGKKQLLVHRIVLGLMSPTKKVVDHIDRDTLNNCKSNLRVVDVQTNCRNRGKTILNKSGFKGVHWSILRAKWHAKIMHKGKKIWCGSSDNVEEAAKMYDKTAYSIWGESAYLNFPDQMEQK